MVVALAMNGPWVMADMENGFFGCAEKSCPNNSMVKNEFLTAMLKGGSGRTLSLKVSNAQSGKLKPIYEGLRPKDYLVMKKQGGIVLGIGGNRENNGYGVFYEGVIVTGIPNLLTNVLVQQNIVHAAYGGNSEQFAN
ncbi:unnamed protein product [Peronospora belbahrii]|uniref:Alpha-L-arabinofuranosidase B catalytic domain-containing protein n=1 Tax=Peronospora belbahrii TaxID=622444 RepID=A0AAU9L9U0_9STRA|nr:unnamed protein product [Peronospora belbahrii]